VRRGPAPGCYGAARGLGFSLAEVLVALVLAALLAQMLLTLLGAHRRLATRAALSVEEREATRLVRELLGSELREAVPGRDGAVPVEDTVGLRVFRGVARACSDDAGTGAVRVEVLGGIRRADPEKDSLLVLGADGVWRALALEGRWGAARSCGEGGEEWRIGEALPSAPLLLRYFERGSYHFVDGVLRYRRGGGGRQPLVPPLFLQEGSGMYSRGSRVELFLTLRSDSSGEARRWSLYSREEP